MPFDRKFWIAVVVIFVVTMLIGFVNHGMLLFDDYKALTPTVMRSDVEAQQKFVYQLVAHLVMAFGFVWLFREGHDAGRPWLGQGVRFGLAFALAATIPIFLIYHAVANFPLDLAIKQCIFDTIGVILAGAVVSFLHR
jgi:amino acid transporter